jgi:N-acetylglutamate synthase-like GNAT family acetyltransferase
MTFGSNGNFLIRKAVIEDLDTIKHLADLHKEELGFVLRPALEKAIIDQELFIAEAEGMVVGFVHYHHRRDQQTTLYHIVVSEDSRRAGVGQALVNALSEESNEMGKTFILLKCPQNLLANHFYEGVGFSLKRVENGKHRPLNVWVLTV